VPVTSSREKQKLIEVFESFATAMAKPDKDYRNKKD
jgi:hypothetical protein